MLSFFYWALYQLAWILAAFSARWKSIVEKEDFSRLFHACAIIRRFYIYSIGVQASHNLSIYISEKLCTCEKLKSVHTCAGGKLSVTDKMLSLISAALAFFISTVTFSQFERFDVRSLQHIVLKTCAFILP